VIFSSYGGTLTQLHNKEMQPSTFEGGISCVLLVMNLEPTDNIITNLTIC